MWLERKLVMLPTEKASFLYEGGTWSDEHERLVRLEFKKWIEENLIK